MAEYSQRGKRKCPNCKTETMQKTCPNCNKTTIGSGNWTVRFRFVENGKVVYKRLSGFKTKKDAENGMNKFLNENKDSNKNKTTILLLNDAYEQFIEFKKNEIKESSIYTFNSLYNNYIKEYFYNKDIASLTKLDYFYWLGTLKNKSLSPKYIEIIKGLMINLLNWVESVFDLPNLLLKLPKTRNLHQTTEMSFFDFEQWQQFEKVVKNDIVYDSLFSILYYMGTRIGETIALTDEDIDFNNNVIHITKSLTRKVKGVTYKITTPKNASSNRDISMPNKLAVKLKNYLKWKKEQSISHEFLFGGDKPLAENTYARRFRYYCQQANLPIIRIHDLRHSHASLLINNGANVMLVAKRMGHSTPTETLNRYAKLFHSADDEIISKLNSL